MNESDKIDVDALLANNPILRTLESKYGMTFTQSGGEYYTKCPFHSDGKRGNLRVNENKKLWCCDVCGIGGNLISFVMKKDGKDFVQACELLGSKPKEKKKRADVSNQVPVATYDYTDQFSNLVYQVCRYHITDPEKECGYSKDFRQRRPDRNGGWIWNMEGVQRVIYRLPEILSATTQNEIINIVEGEKDADNLASLGFLATTNVGGAGKNKWFLSYSDFLENREIAIWPDSDDPGREHAQEVFTKVAPKAKSVRLMQVPPPYKDISDWTDTFVDDNDAISKIRSLLTGATPLYGGVELPVYSISELEQDYRRQTQQANSSILNLAKWLPSLQGDVRGIVPGELAVFLAATGVGKTCLLQNLAINAEPLTTLLFELELPGELTFERFIASSTKTLCADVFYSYSIGRDIPWREGKPMDHIYTCARSSLTCDKIERIIDKSELKIGKRPALVLIDYIQLIQSDNRASRYERVSEVAERLKTLAKNTNTIIFLASQISRRDPEDNPEVLLYDGKDSGSIENSSGLVIGAWRQPGDPSTLNLRVLKNTKGQPGKLVACNFDGARMLITERSKISDADVPSLPYTEN